MPRRFALIFALILVASVALAATGFVGAARHASQETGPAQASGFSIRFQDEVSPFRLTSAFLMPDEDLGIEALLGDPAARFVATAEAGTLEPTGPAAWRWRAPSKPGHFDVRVRDSRGGEASVVRAFVLRPYDGADVFHGYRIGRYEDVPLRDDPGYGVPAGLVEVTEANRDVAVSPSFRLEQFLCKQESGYPKYLALRTRLLLKLEMLLEAVREHGIEAETFHVMSGYRTPHYNRAIGNRSRYSRHLYGDAADVFVDRDGDGTMDDLTGDGQIDRADARKLYRAIDALETYAWYEPFTGGLGLYGPAPHRGPFVHVDTRGRRARW